jgi:hypothetical protein
MAGPGRTYHSLTASLAALRAAVGLAPIAGGAKEEDPEAKGATLLKKKLHVRTLRADGQELDGAAQRRHSCRQPTATLRRARVAQTRALSFMAARYCAGGVRPPTTPVEFSARPSKFSGSLLPSTLTCLAQLLGPARRRFQWFNWTKRWRKRASEDRAVGEGRFAEEITEPVELEVAPLPCWEGLGEEERQRAVRGLVEEVEAEARAQDKPVLGVRAVRAQHPHTRPERLKRNPRPLGHASTRQAVTELREQYRTFVAAFREAAARWLRGDFSASFPLFSFPPRVEPGRVARILGHPPWTPSLRTARRQLGGCEGTFRLPFRSTPSRCVSYRVPSHEFFDTLSGERPGEPGRGPRRRRPRGEHPGRLEGL